MMIDGLSVFIQYLKACAAVGSVSTRQIASKARYGEDWAVKSAAIVARADGGAPNLDLPVQNLRVEVRCFAENALAARKILNELITLSRSANRQPVTVETENGLLYGFQQDSGPSELFDDDHEMDFALMFFSVQTAE